MDRRRSSDLETVYKDGQLVISRFARPSGLRLIGAVDASNVDSVVKVLASALNGGSDHDVHIDLSRLEFADVSGIRALVQAAEHADERHQMILHGLPPLMQKVMNVVGWTDLRSLSISDAAFPDGDGTLSEPARELG
jgi:anti-anti-sigma factor